MRDMGGNGVGLKAGSGRYGQVWKILWVTMARKEVHHLVGFRLGRITESLARKCFTEFTGSGPGFGFASIRETFS